MRSGSRRLVAAVCAWGWLAGAAFAQTPPRANTLVQPSAARVSLRAGSSATASVHLEILAGWHVYSNPPSLDYNIPVEVKLGSGFGVAVGKPGYPRGRLEKVAGDEQAMSVYDGAIDVTLPLSAAASAANGVHALQGTVHYQACNDQMCLQPVSVPFTLEVEVTGGAVAGATAAGDTTHAARIDTARGAAAIAPTPGAGFMTAPPAGGSASSEAARRLEEQFARGWVVWLIGLFVGGLGLNLTPCVFPMLGITVSIFGARRREPMPRVVANATAYVLGIVCMYTALGVVAALTGRLFGAALQSPFVSVGLGLLMLVLALSMFGVYDLQAPGWLLDRAGGANTSSLAGLFSSGLAVGVVAAPCVGPFLLGVLAVIGQRGSVAFGIQTMLTLSIGLGLPYLVLATSSGLLSALPRAGEWMEWAKKVFGVLMVAIGLEYVMVGIAAKQAPWVLPAALVLGGLYLGFMEKSANAMVRFRRFKRVAGTLAVAGGVALVLTMTAANAHTIAFRPYDEKALQASLAAGRPVIVDFSADWCVPCHELELQVFPDRDVLAAARPFDAYKADLTHGDTPASKRFDVHGVPTIVLLGPGGDERRELRVEGKLSASEFARRLRATSAGR